MHFLEDGDQFLRQIKLQFYGDMCVSVKYSDSIPLFSTILHQERI